MLYLNPPYYVINGISIFPDHADPLQFYFLPMMPRLSSMQSAGGDDVPSIQLIEYVGQAGSGGFINFDVNIGVDPDALSDTASKLRQQARLSDQPRLSPITFVDGSVRLLILGAESPDPAAPATHPAGGAPPVAPANTPKFVVKVQNYSKPALYGDNQAAFSVQLDQYGATILEQALKGEMVPIAVVYSLDFLALRPAFSVRLHIDWNRVQTYLDENYSGGFLFFSSDIEKSVNKLIDDRVITIDVDTFVDAGDADAHAVASDRDRATSEVYDMIKSTFFESSLPPPNPNQPDGWDKAAAMYRTVSDIALTGGWADVASFSYKKVDLSRTDQKALDVNINERTTVRRTIYPQGHLAGLLDVIKKKKLSADQFILKVDIDNPWFQRRHVTVQSHANFAGDAISSIDVNLKYNGVPKSVTLTGSDSRGEVEWNSVLENGHVRYPVTYSYVVNFKGVDTSQRPAQLGSPELTVETELLDLPPAGTSELYAVATIPIRAYDFPWDRYPHVGVECRYADPDNGINLEASAVLTKDNAGVDWQIFMRNQARRQFQYQLTFALASGGNATMPWTTTGLGKIDVTDPFPHKINLMVVPQLDWKAIDRALVYVAYPSKDDPIIDQSYEFTASKPDSRLFTADREDAKANLVYYEARLLYRDGRILTIPGSVTSDRTLILRTDMKGHQIITVKPEPVDFASVHVSEVDVQLRYVDQRNGFNFAGQFVFSSKADSNAFVYDYLDDGVAPQFKVAVQLDNGQTSNTDWAPVSGNALTIPLSQLP